MTALANALLRAMGAPEKNDLPQPNYAVKEGRIQVDTPSDVHQDEEPNFCEDPHYYYGYDEEVSRYVAEQDWETQRLNYRAFERSQKVLPWANQGTCDEHREQLVKLLTAKGWTLLLHSWNSTDDGFPYFVGWYDYAHHQSLMFAAPDGLAFAFTVKYTTQRSAEGETKSICVNLVTELDASYERTLSESPVSVRGLYGGGSSWGQNKSVEGEVRNCQSQHFEPHEHGVLPDPEDMAATFYEALASVKDKVPSAPLQGYVYLGNNVDNSYVFPKSPSFDLFWERAGGYDRVLAFAPKASFTKAWLDKHGNKQYY